MLDIKYEDDCLILREHILSSSIMIHRHSEEAIPISKSRSSVGNNAYAVDIIHVHDVVHIYDWSRQLNWFSRSRGIYAFQQFCRRVEF